MSTSQFYSQSELSELNEHNELNKLSELKELKELNEKKDHSSNRDTGHNMIYSNLFEKNPHLKDSNIGTAFRYKVREAIFRPIFYHENLAFLAISMLCFTTLYWNYLFGCILLVLTMLFCIINTHIYGFPYSFTRSNNNDQNPDIDSSISNVPVFWKTEKIGNYDLEFANQKILRIKANNNFGSGFIQGYVLAEKAESMLKKIKRLYWILRLLRVWPFKINIPEWGSPELMKFKHTIPSELIEEMKGIVEGHNEWLIHEGRYKGDQSDKINLEDVIMLHLMPDVHNLNLPSLLGSGCTAGLFRYASTQNDSPTVNIFHFRNTDWPSYNEAASQTLWIERYIANQNWTRCLSFPLLVGAVYGENQHGLTVSINVSGGGIVHNNDGILACVLYREYLRRCKTVKDVKDWIRYGYMEPIGPCQLTMSDREDGSIVRFFQVASKCPHNSDKYIYDHDISDLNQVNPILVVANDALFPGPTGVPEPVDSHDSYARIKTVLKAFNIVFYVSKDPKDITEEILSCIKGALSSAPVNNCQSVHTVIHDNKNTWLSVDNGFSGRHDPVKQF